MAKKHRLFQNIWNKAFKKGEAVEKLADDLGQFKGIFQYSQYDPSTGLILNTSEKLNTITNLSKSNIIRLLAQSQSPWIGNITPDDLRISRMRFGNNSVFNATNARLHYYKLDEPSTRSNTPIATPTQTPFAGGYRGKVTLPGIASTVQTIEGAYTSGFTLGPNGTKIYTVPGIYQVGNTNPPSHATMRVELYNNSTLVETLYFGNESGASGTYVYTRTREGIAPTQITTVAGQYPIVTPVDANRANDDTGGTTTISGTNSDQCGTRLFYDYATGTSGWKLKLEEIKGEGDTYLGRFNRIIFYYEVGRYNVINSVIPRIGYNTGNGLTELDRFQGNQSWYPILAGSEYRDADADFIDDYSITFSANMTGQYGNGQTVAAAGENISYKEAFLQNGRDELFSIVSLPTPFTKNSAAAYLVSWSILAPIS